MIRSSGGELTPPYSFPLIYPSLVSTTYAHPCVSLIRYPRNGLQRIRIRGFRSPLWYTLRRISLVIMLFFGAHYGSIIFK